MASTSEYLLSVLDDLKKDYLKGMSTIELTKKYLPDSKSRSNTTLETILKENTTAAERAKRPKIIGTTAKGLSPANIILNNPKAKAEFVKFGNTPGNTILDSMEEAGKIAKKYGPKGAKIAGYTSRTGFIDSGLRKLITKNVQLGSQGVNPEVTKRLNSIIKAIDSTDLPTGKISVDNPIIKTLAKKSNLSVDKLLSDISKIRQNKDRVNMTDKVLKNIGRFPDPKFMREFFIAKGYSKKTAQVVEDVEKAAKQVTSGSTNLEHALSKAAVRDFNLPRKYLLTAERTSNFLNQFKKQYDNILYNAAKKHAAGELSYKDYKRLVENISKKVSGLTGGYKIGYVDFDDGKPFAVTPQESLLKGEGELGKKTKGLKNYFKNAIHHNRLYENYTKNPNAPEFSTLRTEIKKGRYKFLPEEEAERTARAIKNFTTAEDFQRLFQKDPNNIFFRALSKLRGVKVPRVGPAGKVIGGATALSMLSTALAADEPQGTESRIKYNKDLGALTEEKDINGVVAPTKVDQAGLLDWVVENPVTTGLGGTGVLAVGTKTGRKASGALLKGLLSTLASPTAALGLYATDVATDIKEGKSADDIILDPIKSAGLLYPEIAKRAGAKFGVGALGRFLLNPLNVGRLLTPAGLALTGAGLVYQGGKGMYEEYQRRQGLTEEERMLEDTEYQAKLDEQMLGP